MFVCLLLFRAVLVAYGGSKARGSNLYSLYYSHSNAGSELICDLHRRLQQRWILNPLSEARDQICLLMDASWVLNPLRHSRNSPCPFLN